MPVPTPEAKKKPADKFLKSLIIFITLVVPGFLIILGMIIFYQSQRARNGASERVNLSQLSDRKIVLPSELLADMSQYEDEEIILEGKVEMSAMICKRQTCPNEDPCCGCEPERNLVIYDDKPSVTRETIDQLRLMDARGQAFCRRKTNSCQYDCGDWQIGNAYQVEGLFVGQPPPLGTVWRRYFDFYFAVTGKKNVKEYGVIDLPQRLYDNIVEIIQRIKKSGYFIIQ